MDNIHGGNLRKESIRFGIEKDLLVDFSANINPFGYPDYLKSLYTDAFEDIGVYPDADSSELIKAISESTKVSPEHILPGNGGAELINASGILFRNKKVGLIQPNFAEYERSLKANEADLTCITGKVSNDFKVELSDIKNIMTEEFSALYLSSPNNPSGHVYLRSEIEEILTICRSCNSYLLVDEAFIDFTNGDNSVFDLVEKNENLIVFRSLTKMYGIPGIRIGYMGAGDISIIERMKSLLPEWSVNSVAQKIGTTLIKDIKFVENSRNKINNLKINFKKSLDSIKGIKRLESEANYFLCRLDAKEQNAHELKDFLGRRGIIIKVCDSYKGLDKSWFRVAVRTESDNCRLTEEISKWIIT